MKHLLLIAALLAPTVGAAQNSDYGSAPGHTGGGPSRPAVTYAPLTIYTPTPNLMPVSCALEIDMWGLKNMICPEGLRPNSKALDNCRCVRG